MTISYKLICPKDIMTYFIDEIKNENRALQIIEAIRRRELFPIAVENTAIGKFVLISGFHEYAAYLKIQPERRIPIVVFPATSEKERLIKILTVIIPLERNTSWIFKNEHIMRLMESYQMDKASIAKATNQDPNKIDNYILDRRIPFAIREISIEKKAKEVVKKICTSQVMSTEMKEILYRKAVLNQDNPLRCNGKKFEYFSEFCKIVNFPLLFLQDEKLLESFINTMIITNFDIDSHWKKLLDDFLIQNQFRI